jgi:hypothetical protein
MLMLRGFSVNNELGDGLGRERLMHRHDIRHPANARDRGDIATEVEAELVVKRRVDGV